MHLASRRSVIASAGASASRAERAWLVRVFAWTALSSAALLPVLDVVASTTAPSLALAPMLNELGRALGAAANGLLTVSVVLGLRAPLFEAILAPLDRLTSLHHHVAVVGYVATLSHPLALAFAASTASASAGARVLFGFGRPAIALGWVALLVLVVVACVSFIGRLRHETWRRIHALGWIVPIFGLCHAVALRGFRPSDALLGGVLASAMVFRFVSGIHGTKRYRVSQTRRLSPEMIEVDLEPLGRAMTFRPGQFIFARFRDPGTGWRCREFHPFTITSDPRDSNLRIDIKKLGDCTRTLLDVKPGYVADVLGPFGGLFGGRTSRHQVWLAGGVGVAPFLSAARSLPHEDRATSIDLFYCTKQRAEAVHLEELRAIAERHPSLRVHHHVDESEGFLTADRVLSESGDSREAEFFIAGPPAFASALRKGLAVHRVTPSRIHSERFRYL